MGARALLLKLAAVPLIACALSARLTHAQNSQERMPRPAPCAAMLSLLLPHTTITLAEALPGGANPEPVGLLPTAICRVAGTIKPAIKFEVWMPIETWNGKFQGVGNTGTAGSPSYGAMRTALGRGYATASTDTGHMSSELFDFAWALDRLDLAADFGHRGLHVATVNAKEITRAFYGKRPDHSYFVGCSTGGQQALMEAQRYPEDYDGIIAGSPANNWTRLYAGGHLWHSMATLKNPDSYIPAAKIALLGNAVTAACDAIDGIVDGVLDDPRNCQFDPAVLTCRQGQNSASCYTPAQVKAIREIWTGVRNSRGELVHRPLTRGGEGGDGGWAAWITGSAPFAGLQWRAADGFFRYLVFQNLDFNALNFDFDADLDAALAKVGATLDSVDSDLRPFRQRGGKLLLHHGWSDANVSPLNTLDYYESVIASLTPQGQGRDEASQEVRRFARLFMVPGMQHCSGGPGPNKFDMLTALENWVERGEPPDRIIASLAENDVVTRTRPLCPYPEVAVYTGSGSTDEEVNFICHAPRAGNPEGFSAPAPIAQRLPQAASTAAPAAPNAPASPNAPPPSNPPSAPLPGTPPSNAPASPNSPPPSNAPSAPLPGTPPSNPPASPNSPAPNAPPPSAPTGQPPPAGSSTVNRAPIWLPATAIEFVEGVPAVVSILGFVRDPDSDPLVITLTSGGLLPGIAWDATAYTITYDGRPMGARPEAPIGTEVIFSADDRRP